MARNPLIRRIPQNKGIDLPKSAGILDDHAIRKVLHTKEITGFPKLNDFTSGSVLFIDSDKKLAQDNANLFWNDDTNLLGIGTAVPFFSLHIKHADLSQGILIEGGSGANVIEFRSAGGASRGFIGTDDSTGGTLATDAGPFDTFVRSEGDLLLLAGGVSGTVAVLDTAQRMTLKQDLIMTDEKFIRTATSDGSDNESTGIAGGGSLSNLRGSFIRVSGNEDGNTGKLFLTAGNVAGGEIRLSTGGSQRMVVDDAGLIGMGLSVPLKNLHISSTVPTIRLSDSDAATDQAVATLIELYRGDNDNRVGFWGMGSSSTDIMEIATDYAAGEIAFSTGSNVEAVRINNVGLVGIGKAPTTLLDIEHTPSASSNSKGFRLTSLADHAAHMEIRRNVSAGSFNTTMGWGIVNDSKSFAIKTGITTGNFESTGSQAITITEAGLLGVRNASPTYTLDVNSGATDIVARFSSTDLNADILLEDNTEYVRIRASAGEFQVLTNNDAQVAISTSSGKVTIPGTFAVTGAVTFSSTLATGAVAVTGNVTGVSRYTSGTANIDTVSGTYTVNKVVYAFNEGRGWSYNSADDAIFAALNDSVAIVIGRFASNLPRVGIGSTAPTAKLHIDNTSGAIPVLRLDQGDVDDTFIDYVGTSAADGSRSISSDTTEDSAKFGAIRCEINGVTKWIRIYDNHS